MGTNVKQNIAISAQPKITRTGPIVGSCWITGGCSTRPRWDNEHDHGPGPPVAGPSASAWVTSAEAAVKSGRESAFEHRIVPQRGGAICFEKGEPEARVRLDRLLTRH